MKRFYPIYLLIAVAVPAVAGVTVSSPTSGATVASPVHYVASATTSTCSKGVASMGIYVDNQLKYVVNGTVLNTTLGIAAGTHDTVVEEWDYCGGATYTHVALNVTSQSGVWVTAPAANATIGSPVTYEATATTATCSKGVASMGIYVDNQLKFVEQGAKLDTSLALSPGAYDTVVEEWDFCGGASFTHIPITVEGNVLPQLQASGGWKTYGEFPPQYSICSSCGPGVTWSMSQHVTSPSMTGNATEFSTGGATPYADVLWTNPVIGQFSSQGLPDPGHTLIPSLHNFTYDVYFYGSSLQLSQVLEFDINQYLNGMGFTWGNQCRIAGGHEFDVWDNVNSKWVPTGVACYPSNNSWNHLTLQVERTSDNQLHYQSITLNGVTSVIDRYFPLHSVPASWYGVTVNYQMDGNYEQAPYSVYVDQLSLTYW
jgi:hypothetical protein